MAANTTVLKYPLADIPGMDWLNRRQLLDRFIQFQPTVLHIWDEEDAELGHYLANRLDLPYILNINSLKKGTELSVSTKRCSALLVPSLTIAESIRATHARLQDRLQIQPMACEVEPHAACFRQARCRPCLVIDYPLVCAAEFHSLFVALRNLKQANYSFAAFLVGPSHDETDIRHMIDQLELQEEVTIHSNQRLTRSILLAGDIYIQLHPVPFYNALCLEAMGVGLAVAACPGGCDDLLTQNPATRLFAEDDPMSLQNTLQSMLDHPQATRKLGEKNRLFVKDQHHPDVMRQGMMQAYEQARSWSFGLKSIA